MVELYDYQNNKLLTKKINTMSEQTNEALDVAKANLATAKEELKKFQKKNGLKADETPNDEKLAKKLSSLQNKVAKAEKEVKIAKKGAKGESAPRASKYEYPADCVTAEDKKKFRTAQRNAAKKGEKVEKKAAKVEKSSKKAAKEETPVVKKKKSVVVED